MGAAMDENGLGYRNSYCVHYEGQDIDVSLAPGLTSIPFRWRLQADAKARDVSIRAMFMIRLQRR